MNTIHVIGDRAEPLDVLGVSVEFLTPPSEPGAAYCLIRGVIPPGMSVPLHSHPDPESIFVLSGSAQVLTERDGRLEWLRVKPGDFVHIPGGSKHAHRNPSTEPVVELVATTPKLGQFFEEIGRPTRPGVALPPPTAEELARFVRLSVEEYGHWLASPEENAAVGLSV